MAADLRRAISVTSPMGGRPRGLSIENRDGVLRIRFWWCSANCFPLAMLVFGMSMLATICFRESDHIVLAFGVVFGAAGAFFTWVFLAFLLNRTIIEASADQLTIRHNPLPWPGCRRRIPAGQILQLYIELVDTGKLGPIARIRAALVDGTRPALTWFLQNRKFAWPSLIEKEIEAHLKIVKRPIVCPDCGRDVGTTQRRCPKCGTKVGGRRPMSDRCRTY